MTLESEIHALRQTSVRVAQDYVDRPVILRGYLKQVIAPSLIGVLSTINEEILKRFHRPKVKTPITHYTSLATLLSLIESSSETPEASSLRLSPTFRFNDPTEGAYLPQEIARATRHDWLEAEVVPLAFAACFVSNDNKNASDDLVCWRSYGLNGEGCSITWTPNDSANIYTVAYSDGVKRITKRFEPVLHAIKPLVYVSNHDRSREAQRIFGGIFQSSLMKLRYLHKDDAYRHERESRLLITEGDQSFRPDRVVFAREDGPGGRPDLRRYYVDPSLAAERIFRSGTTITLGPLVPYAKDAKAYIEDRLKSPLIAEVKVSSVPYRTT